MTTEQRWPRPLEPALGDGDDFGAALDKMVQAKGDKHQERQRREMEAGDRCFEIIREMINPLLDAAAERYNLSGLSTRLDVRSHEEVNGPSGAVSLGVYEIDDREGEEKGERGVPLDNMPAEWVLVFYCDPENEVMTIDLAELQNPQQFTWSIDRADQDVVLFRKRAGQATWNYASITKSIIQKKILLYVEMFG